jgi:hypothetical protein
MRSHIVVHRATTNSSAKSFSFRSKIEKEGLPRGTTSALETSAQKLVGKLTRLPGEQVLKHLPAIGSRFVAIAVAGGTGERRGPVFENRDIRATTLAPQHQMMTLGR